MHLDSFALKSEVVDIYSKVKNYMEKRNREGFFDFFSHARPTGHSKITKHKTKKQTLRTTFSFDK